jgi:hypothetical protein
MLKEFVDTFINVASSHLNVNNVRVGEIADIAETGKDNYILVHLEMPFLITSENGVDNLDLRFYVLDREDDTALYVDRIDATKKIGQEILYYIRKYYKNSFKISDDYSITSLIEFSDDSSIGCLFECQVSFKNEVNNCDIDSIIVL